MILVVGLSPAWQRALWFGNVRLGSVNRARRVLETTAGKGPNVARIIGMLGGRSRLLTIAGGHRGRLVAQSLSQDGVNARVVRVEGESRLCQTLIDPRGATELVEEVPPLGRNEVAKLLAVFDREIRSARMLVLVGSVPKGCGDDFYARLIRKARRREIRVLVDAQTTQLQNAIREKPFLVRLANHELEEATDRQCHGPRGIENAARELLVAGVRWVVVSSGGGPVYAFSGGQSWRAMPPRIKVVNPIGSGDAMMAGIACKLLGGEKVIDAVRFGIGCGTANALMARAGVLRLADAERLGRRIRWFGP